MVGMETIPISTDSHMKFYADNESYDIPPERIRKGNCSAKSCGPEEACQQLRVDSYTCVCPHDFSLPTKDLKCNRVIVPITPSPIHINIIPPSESNNTVSTSTLAPSDPDIFDVLDSRPDLLDPATISLFGLVFVAFFGIICACCFCKLPSNRGEREQKRRRQNLAIPIECTRGIIDDDRFVSNPQYLVSMPDDLQTPDNVHLPQLPRDAVRFENVIGEGCFGKVYKGKLKVDGRAEETVAIKVLKETATPEAEDDFMREVEIMASFQHQNILSLLGFVAKELGKSPCMVFEFMPHGDLTEVLRGNSKTFWKSDPGFPRLTKDSLLSIAIQIAKGMRYLAEQHFVHRDLACRNCLVGENITVKIADFGMSRDVYTCDYYRIGGSRLMPVRWMSPESISYGRFTLESDVWSFGVVLWEIYSLGKQPYFGHSNEEVVRLILQGVMLVPPEDCPTAISEIMSLCWKMEPKERTDFVQIHERLVRMFNLEISNNLPRPPPFMVTTSIPELPEIEVEYYLKPQPSSPPHEYLQPLPD